MVAAAVVGTAPAGAEEPYLLKFASLAPEGSTWQNGLQAAADELREKSHGRLVVRMYAGGVAGTRRTSCARSRSASSTVAPSPASASAR